MKIEKNFEKYKGLHDLAAEHDFGVLKFTNLGAYESDYDLDYEILKTEQ